MATIHASAVLVGARAILIRGQSGVGKSRLALELIEAPGRGSVRFARLVGDDRVHVEAVGGRLLVRPAPALTGLIELRGLGILRRDFEACAVVGLVVDLGAEDAERLPERREVFIEGIGLPWLGVAQGMPPLPAVLALIGLLGTGRATSAATGPATELSGPRIGNPVWEPRLGID